jgi:hypothetical protein
MLSPFLRDAPKFAFLSSIVFGLWLKKKVEAQLGRTEIKNVQVIFFSPSSLETDSESLSTQSRTLDSLKQSDVMAMEFGCFRLSSKSYFDESVCALLVRAEHNL